MSDSSVTPALAAHREALADRFVEVLEDDYGWWDAYNDSRHPSERTLAFARRLADVALADPAHGLVRDEPSGMSLAEVARNARGVRDEPSENGVGEPCVGCRDEVGDCCHLVPSGPACTCAGAIVGTNAHEDTCALNEQRWDDREYVTLWEQRTGSCPLHARSDEPSEDERPVRPRHLRPHAEFGDTPDGSCGCAGCDPRDNCGCPTCLNPDAHEPSHEDVDRDALRDLFLDRAGNGHRAITSNRATAERAADMVLDYLAARLRHDDGEADR